MVSAGFVCGEFIEGEMFPLGMETALYGGAVPLLSCEAHHLTSQHERVGISPMLERVPTVSAVERSYML
jgi:hypothetical protein